MSAAPLVWIDCEMTGLDLDDDRLVEVAVLVTDAELNVAGRRRRPRHHAPDGRSTRCPVVRDDARRLRADGRARASTAHAAEAEQQVLAYVREYVPDPQGAAVRQLDRHRPRLPRPRHAGARRPPALPDGRRRSVKELARRWYPRAYYASPEKKGGHRALADILESIEELKYYRQAVFVAAARAGRPSGPGHRRAPYRDRRHRRKRGAPTGPALPVRLDPAGAAAVGRSWWV